MKERLRQFMAGRYGVDELGRVLNILILAILILGAFFMSALSLVGVGLLVWQYFRMLSRSPYKRQQENLAYLRLKKKISAPLVLLWQRIAQRKTHRFFQCPSCGQRLRVPRGKGTLAITCPKCHTRFHKKT